MRVLVASIPFPQNRFFVDLNTALSQHCKIEQSSDIFWNMEGEYDVVHLHFPEYLTFDLTKAYLEGLSDELIDAVKTRLDYWSERARIVVTRHVLLPHDALKDPQWEKLYAMFYRYADAVVHFAGASEKEFRERYRSLDFHRGRRPRHRIIPHHNYASLPNTISRDEARNRLGIKRDACVMLAFGAIRSDQERELVLRTFRGLRLRKRVLLVSRWRETLPDVSWIRLKYWLRDLTRAYYRVHPQYVLNYGFVSEEDTQIFLNSCDVLFIPRLRVLNSGNVTLGMTFGRVVVGPDSWDVGELLRGSGNPVFDPDNPNSAIEAVERGFALAQDGKIPRANRETALREWTPEQCAASYLDLFTTIAHAE
jgi:glycosyltransferase involved in cell wall biosynthesis